MALIMIEPLLRHGELGAKRPNAIHRHLLVPQERRGDVAAPLAVRLALDDDGHQGAALMRAAAVRPGDGLVHVHARHRRAILLGLEQFGVGAVGHFNPRMRCSSSMCAMIAKLSSPNGVPPRVFVQCSTASEGSKERHPALTSTGSLVR